MKEVFDNSQNLYKQLQQLRPKQRKETLAELRVKELSRALGTNKIRPTNKEQPHHVYWIICGTNNSVDLSPLEKYCGWSIVEGRCDKFHLTDWNGGGTRKLQNWIKRYKKEHNIQDTIQTPPTHAVVFLCTPGPNIKIAFQDNEQATTFQKEYQISTRHDQPNT